MIQTPSTSVVNAGDLQTVVHQTIDSQPIVDVHTHLYTPGFGTPVPNASGHVDPNGLSLWGIDELVTYHYLIAEVYRVVPASRFPYEQFWKMTKRQQADHIWKHLFIEHTPISEACRGVLTTLQHLGLDPNEKSLDKYRPFFDKQDPSKFIDKVMEISHVKSITMTNPVFDDNERARWLANPQVGVDPRFKAVLRIDPILRDYPAAAKQMSGLGLRCAARNRARNRSRKPGVSCATGSTGRRRSTLPSACRRNSASPPTRPTQSVARDSRCSKKSFSPSAPSAACPLP